MSQTSKEDIRAFLTWVWGGVFILSGGLFLGLTTGLLPYKGPLLPVLAGAAGAISLPFIGRWLARGHERWALLTAWTFLALGGALLALYLNPQHEQLMLAELLGALALPLLIQGVRGQGRWWTLIPGYLVLLLAILVGLTALSVSLETLAGAGLIALAVPLWVLYFANRKAWASLAVAAPLTVFGLGTLLFFTVLEPGSQAFYILLNSVLAALFAALWIGGRSFERRVGMKIFRLDWALWLTAGFAGAGILSVWFPSATNWGLLILVMGLYILYRQVGGKQPQPAVSSPTVIQGKAQPVPPVSTGTSQPPPQAPEPPPPAAPAGPPPGVEFRPLDPFKDRRG